MFLMDERDIIVTKTVSSNLRDFFLFLGDSCVHLCMCARSWCVTMPSIRAQVPTRSGISRRDTVKDETTKAKKTNDSSEKHMNVH